jgi:hypothetical protein
MSERCEQIINASLEELSFNVDGVSLSELYQDDWIRILIVREKEESNYFTLEIEFSTPSPERLDVQPSILLSQAIEYLKYMQRLEKMGFTLELVDQDWLWSAHRKFTESPSFKLFEQLLPPSS